MSRTHSFVITKKNLETEKEGIIYLLEQDHRFFDPDKESRKEIMKEFGLTKKYARAFDLVFIPERSVSDRGKIMVNKSKMILVEMKTTKKTLPDNPHGFFFGATKNEFDLAEKLGPKFRFCFVCLCPRHKSFAMVTAEELEKLVKNKRIQYQINLKRKEK